MSVSVRVADVHATVLLQDPLLRDVVERRYQGFLVNSPDAITIRMGGPPMDRTYAVTGEVVRNGGRLELKENPALGWVEPARGEGELTPHPGMMGLDMLLRALVTLEALRRGGLVLHAASVELGGVAHVFMGVSGAGKTTLATKLRNEGARVLSDEMTVLHPTPSGWTVHGTPYRFGTAAPAPLGGLWTLRQGAEISVVMLDGQSTLRALVRNLSLPIRGDTEVRASMDAAARLSLCMRARELTSALADALRTVVEAA